MSCKEQEQNVVITPEHREQITRHIQQVRERYLGAPTYYSEVDSHGVAAGMALQKKYIHRNWWDEFYDEIDYGGQWLKTYYDDVSDFVTQVCAEQAGLKTEHERLMEEDDNWYDLSDPMSYRHDPSLGPDSTGCKVVDEYADALSEELVEKFALEGPEYNRTLLEKYVAEEGQKKERALASDDQDVSCQDVE
jgi:hypothetical protein